MNRTDFFEQFPDQWHGKDAQVKNWQKYFWGGPYSWENQEEWSEYKFRAHVTSNRRHDEHPDAHGGWIDFEWDIDYDAMAYQLIPDPDPRMTYMLAHFIEEVRDGNWDDIDLFQSWCELQLDEAASDFIKITYPTSEWRVRRDLIKSRLDLAHNAHKDGGAGTPQTQRIVQYLEQAIHQLSEDWEAVFEVNGYSNSFEDASLGLWALWLMWDYARGESGTIKTLPWADGENTAWRMGRTWDDVYYWTNPAGPRYFEHTLGYVLKICDDAVARAIEGNKKKNAQIHQEARAKQLNKGLYRKGSEEIFGVAPYDHDTPFHSGHEDIYCFEVGGVPYAAFTEQETPSGHVPVFEWDYEWPNYLVDATHGMASIICNTCERYWDYEHGVFYDQNYYDGPLAKFNHLPFIEMWELLEMQEELVEENTEKLPPIPVAPNQQKMFDDEQLYEHVLKWGEASSAEYGDLVWLEGVVVVDDDDNVYCPTCHNKLTFGCHVDFSE